MEPGDKKSQIDIKMKDDSRTKGKSNTRSDSGGPIEGTFDDKGSEKDDGQSSSLRHREARKDEESKHCGVK